jgi:hypothetical protein
MTEEQKQTDQEDLDKSYQNRLYPEDQARVDAFISRGVNSVERKPFRPFVLLAVLLVVVTGLSAVSLLLARLSGVY